MVHVVTCGEGRDLLNRLDPEVGSSPGKGPRQAASQDDTVAQHQVRHILGQLEAQR